MGFFLLIYGTASLVFSGTVALYTKLTGISLEAALPIMRWLWILGFVGIGAGYPVISLSLINDKPGKNKQTVVFVFLAMLIASALLHGILPEVKIFLIVIYSLIILSYFSFVWTSIRFWLGSNNSVQGKIKLLIAGIGICSLPSILPGSWISPFYSLLYLELISVSIIIISLIIFPKPVQTDKTTFLHLLCESFSVSEREAEIIWHLLLGKSARNIADKLSISTKTVQNHTANIYRKTGISSKFQLIQLVQIKIGTIT